MLKKGMLKNRERKTFTMTKRVRINIKDVGTVSSLKIIKLKDEIVNKISEESNP